MGQTFVHQARAEMPGNPTASPSPETVSDLLILATVFHVLAFILTLFRLWFRYRIRRLWWDDFWAALALLSDVVCTVAMWILAAPLDNPYVTIESLLTPAQSRSAHIISFWLNILFFTCSVWFARISIAFSVFRVAPPSRSVSMITFGTGGMFACMWAYILTGKSVVCAMDKSWYDSPATQCPFPNWVTISQICTEALSDIILVVLPLRLLWRVKLPSSQRTMVLSVFSASVLVTVVSVVHTLYLIPDVIFLGAFTAEMESTVSLIVCNLLVVVTFLHRVLGIGGNLAEGLAGRNTRPSNHLTTVDLDLSGGSGFTSATGTWTSGTNTSSFTMVDSTSEKDATSGPITTGGAASTSTETSPPLMPARQ